MERYYILTREQEQSEDTWPLLSSLPPQVQRQSLTSESWAWGTGPAMYVPAPKLSSKRKVGWLGCSNFKQPLMKRPTRPFAPCPGWAPRWGPREVGHALSHTMRVGEMETRQTWVSREAWLLEEVQEGQKSNKCFSRDERIEYKRDCPLDTFLERPFVSVHLCARLCVCRDFHREEQGSSCWLLLGRQMEQCF